MAATSHDEKARLAIVERENRELRKKLEQVEREHKDLKRAYFQLSLRQRSDVRYHGLDLHFRPHPSGNLFREAEALSFGQKRLFTWLVLSAFCPHVPLFADELTNGLHHALVRTCIEAIGDRQAFLATQEPLLLDHLEFDSAEAVRKTFVLCRTNEAGQWVWEKPSAEMAEAVYGSYCVDVKHVSEIVRTLGLW